MPAAVRERLVGCYRSLDLSGAVEVLAQEERLLWRRSDGKNNRLLHQGQGVCVSEDELREFTFHGSPDRAAGLVISTYGMALGFSRVPCESARAR